MPVLRFVLPFIALLVATSTMAQTTYRWVDKATGQTVYSDQPPPPGTQAVVKEAKGESGAEQQMPYAIRQAAEKFPVVLYTAASCVDECKNARDLLNGRGVPFSEKMLSTQEEVDALAKLLGSEAGVPSLSVGKQNYKGFESGAWNNLLDLAGYPKTATFGAKPSGAFAQ
jgi:glutaredoxin